MRNNKYILALVTFVTLGSLTSCNNDNDIVDPGLHEDHRHHAVVDLNVLDAGHHVTVGLEALSEPLDVVPKKDSVEDHARSGKKQGFQLFFLVDGVALKPNLGDHRVLGDHVGHFNAVAGGLHFRVHIGEESQVVNRLNILRDGLLAQRFAHVCLHRTQDVFRHYLAVAFHFERGDFLRSPCA